MEYMIYATALFASILFQIFWAWCNNNTKKSALIKVREQLSDANEKIHQLEEKISKLYADHQGELRQLRNEHRRALSKKEKERHKSCEKRNKTIDYLLERNRIIQSKLNAAEKKVVLLEKIKQITNSLK